MQAADPTNRLIEISTTSKLYLLNRNALGICKVTDQTRTPILCDRSSSIRGSLDRALGMLFSKGGVWVGGTPGFRSLYVLAPQVLTQFSKNKLPIESPSSSSDSSQKTATDLKERIKKSIDKFSERKGKRVGK